MKKVAVLDYENARVNVILVPQKLQDADEETIEEYIESQGFNLTNCEYIFGEIKYSEEMTDTNLEDRWPLK